MFLYMAGELKWGDLQDSFQHKPFYGSMTLWFYGSIYAWNGKQKSSTSDWNINIHMELMREIVPVLIMLFVSY